MIKNNLNKKPKNSKKKKKKIRSKTNIRNRNMKKNVKYVKIENDDKEEDVINKNDSKNSNTTIIINNNNNMVQPQTDKSNSNNNDANTATTTNNHYNFYINIGIVCLSIITIVTILAVYSLKDSKLDSTTVNILHVWAYSWMTAVCTGLGAVPFFMIDNVNDFWLGICNALAGGMMIAASFVLVYEGAAEGFDEQADEAVPFYVTIIKLLIGFLLGVGFVRICRKRLVEYEDLKMGNLDGLEARKILLVVGVMTIHSLSEGVGIGVAFSGRAGLRLGSVVSSSLAVHNIPEGLAVALVLVPKGISAKGAVVWSIFSSIPQPVMAIPTYLFVAQFLHVLPIGLGFAAGAMIDVAGMELLPEALEMINNVWITIIVTMIASVLMLCSQFFLSG